MLKGYTVIDFDLFDFKVEWVQKMFCFFQERGVVTKDGRFAIFNKSLVADKPETERKYVESCMKLHGRNKVPDELIVKMTMMGFTTAEQILAFDISHIEDKLIENAQAAIDVCSAKNDLIKQ